MSAQLRDLSKQMEDKDFVKTYFYGVTSGQDVTYRLLKDGVTLNSPDLIARLVGWLEEAEPTDDAANKQAQTQQQLSSMKLPSQQEESSSESSSSEESAPASGTTSSDGSTKPSDTSTSSTSTQKPNFEFGSGSK